MFKILKNIYYISLCIEIALTEIYNGWHMFINKKKNMYAINFD